MNNESNQRAKIKSLTVAALIIAIVIILALTNLGILMITPLGVSIVHIPVIVGALLLGANYGAFFGFMFGLLSFLIATLQTPPTGFLFSPFAPGPPGLSGNWASLIVCFVPRILIGVFTALSLKLFLKLFKKPFLAYGSAALIGSITNTVLVLSFMYIFFFRSGELAESILGVSLMSIVVMQGIPEAIVAALVSSALSGVLVKQGEKLKNRN
ncbi:MAG: ECF transporter S component [Ruminococcaceae bacterium]|nr:ECF transporter S component [Oscillospiraceae bacterium]